MLNWHRTPAHTIPSSTDLRRVLPPSIRHYSKHGPQTTPRSKAVGITELRQVTVHALNFASRLGQEVESNVEVAAAPVQPAAEPVPPKGASLRAVAEQEAEQPAVQCRIVVPHYETRPGQQLVLTGDLPALGGWRAEAGVPLTWREGHMHEAAVALPPGRVVQAKLVLVENGEPAITEEGAPRDLMLLPTSLASAGLGPTSISRPTSSNDTLDSGSPEQLADEAVSAADGAVTLAVPPAAAAAPGGGAGRLDYQIMCHFGDTQATQILRLPIVLPAKDPADRRALCKFVVLLDGLKLEPRQYPVVVGSSPELGSWDVARGVKLMRQVGGYWTRRVELPLAAGADIQAKVVICSPAGEPALWEPGTSNRLLAPAPHTGAGPEASMHVFVCRWSAPGVTPCVGVPVEREDPAREYVKQLDAAQREISIMRQAVTAKSRQVAAAEGELAASRRAERGLREELAAARAQLTGAEQEVEEAVLGELEARREAAALQEQLGRLGETYQAQISVLERRLEEMEQEMASLVEAAAQAAAERNGSSIGSSNGASNGANGHSWYESNDSSNGSASHGAVPSHPITRAKWR